MQNDETKLKVAAMRQRSARGLDIGKMESLKFIETLVGLSALCGKAAKPHATAADKGIVFWLLRQDV